MLHRNQCIARYRFGDGKTLENMKLHTTVTAGLNSVTAYGSGYISVNGRMLEKSFVLTPHQLIENWDARSLAELSVDQVNELTRLNCDVLLLGTGKTQRFPDKSILKTFLAQGIGVEVMDNFAACRTYNILMAEGRAVALAVLADTVP